MIQIQQEYSDFSSTEILRKDIQARMSNLIIHTLSCSPSLTFFLFTCLCVCVTYIYILYKAVYVEAKIYVRMNYLEGERPFKQNNKHGG